MLNFVPVLNEVTPEDMVEEQKKDPIIGLVCPCVTAREKLKSSAITKIKSKAVQKYLLQVDRLKFKQRVRIKYVRNCPQCQVAKGPYVSPKTKPGSIIVNGPLDLL